MIPQNTPIFRDFVFSSFRDKKNLNTKTQKNETTKFNRFGLGIGGPLIDF